MWRPSILIFERKNLSSVLNTRFSNLSFVSFIILFLKTIVKWPRSPHGLTSSNNVVIMIIIIFIIYQHFSNYTYFKPRNLNSSIFDFNLSTLCEYSEGLLIEKIIFHISLLFNPLRTCSNKASTQTYKRTQTKQTNKYKIKQII